jgi:hypothetical protein
VAQSPAKARKLSLQYIVQTSSVTNTAIALHSPGVKKPGLNPTTNSPMKKQLVVPHTIRQTKIPELLGKGKAVPLQAWSGPEGSRKLRLPDFTTTAQDGGKVFSLTHRPPLPPGNTPGTHFC